jgi:hypothetical protein
MSRMIGLAIVSALLAAPGSSAWGDAKKPAAPAKPVAAKKAPPKKVVPVTAEHKKVLADLFNGFKFGMTKDEVIALLSKHLDDQYTDQIKGTTDITAQDRLRKDKKAELARVAQSYVTFDGGKVSGWDVSIIEDEFAHNTDESMIERWENSGGKNQRRFFFFYGQKLWKMFVQLDVSILPEDKRNFATFQGVMENKYGPGEIDTGKITWRTDEFDVRAIDQLKSYGAIALAIEDPKTRRDVEAIRESKAPPKHETNSVIKAVVDPDHTDHPDVKQNGNAVDDVIKAQGGTPPKSSGTPPKK